MILHWISFKNKRTGSPCFTFSLAHGWLRQSCYTVRDFFTFSSDCKCSCFALPLENSVREGQKLIIFLHRLYASNISTGDMVPWEKPVQTSCKRRNMLWDLRIAEPELQSLHLQLKWRKTTLTLLNRPSNWPFLEETRKKHIATVPSLQRKWKSHQLLQVPGKQNPKNCLKLREEASQSSCLCQPLQSSLAWGKGEHLGFF